MRQRIKLDSRGKCSIVTFNLLSFQTFFGSSTGLMKLVRPLLVRRSLVWCSPIGLRGTTLTTVYEEDRFSFSKNLGQTLKFLSLVLVSPN